MQLPAELVSLIHHIELNQSGWWDKALQRFLIGAVAESGPITKRDLVVFVRERYGLPLDLSTAQRHTDALVEDGDFVILADDRVKLTEATTRQVAGDVARAQEQTKHLRTKLQDAMIAEGLSEDVETVWAGFEANFLTPLVSELGARTYDLLVAGTSQDSGPNLQELIGRARSQFGDEFRRAVVTFLDPSDPDVRAYVLRTLSAYFFVQASSVDERVLASLDSSRERHVQLRVFLDTNFLFSILRLHDNPSNDVAEALDDLLGRVRERVGISLYVLPVTVEEVRTVLRWHMSALAGVRPPRNVARAVVDRPELSGLTKRYLMAAAQSEHALTAEDFFGLYESSLLTILKERGVELFNESLDPYRTRQDVIDDVADEEQYLKEHHKAQPSRRPKSYDRILHDVILWHVVDDKRPQVTDSPLDVGYWLVTEDWRFVGFDRSKRGDRGYAVCLTPAALMQLLQFWLPRSEELDRALVGSIRLPFLLEDFDRDAERVTTRILRSLSKYEGVEDLSVETVSDILMSQALRTRLARKADESDDEVLLREAFVERAAELERQLAAAQQEAALAQSQASDSDQVIAAKEEQRAHLERELNELREATRETVEQEAARRRMLEGHVASLEDQLLLARAKRRFAVTAMGLLICVSVLGIGIFLGLKTVELAEWLAAGIASALALGLWLGAVGFIGSRSVRLKDWPVVTFVSLSGHLLLKVCGVLTIGVVSSLIAIVIERG